MAIGTTAALVAGSVASSAIGAKASKKAGEAAAASADAATNLQRDIYDETTQRYAPYLEAGGNALQAVLYEMGLAPKPVFGASTPTVEAFQETIPGTPGTNGRIPGSSPIPGGRPSGKYDPADNNTGGTPARTVDKFRVGDRTFETRSAAEEYAAANKTGGTEYGGYTESPMFKYMMEKGTDSIQGSAAARGGLFSGATLQALEDNRRELVSADTGQYFSRLAGLTDMGLSAAGNQASAGQNFANNAGQSMMAAGQARANGMLGAAQSWQTGISDVAGAYGYFGGFGSNPMAAYSAPTLMASSPRPMANPYY